MLTLDQKRRYARNIMLSGIGESGQERLLASKVLVIGAGGLGSALLSYLSASGIGTIGIVDADRVEQSNLQRQIIHEHADIGRLKVESAKDRISELNLDVKVEIFPDRLCDQNADTILSSYDIVADGCDNFETRFLVADGCAKHHKTLVSAAVKGFDGQLSTFKPYLGAPHPFYRDLVPELPPNPDTCTETGVLGSICGILGSMQATEIIKEILGIGESLSGTLIRYDALAQTFKKSIIRRD